MEIKSVLLLKHHIFLVKTLSIFDGITTIGVFMIIKRIFFFKIVKDSNQNSMSNGILQF